MDYLPHDRPGVTRKGHIVAGVLQLLGESYFTLLEASPKREADYNIRDRIYIGRGRRLQVGRILSRITYDALTSSAKAELQAVIEQVVTRHENRFIEFINTSPPLTPRMHSLELIPGVGKKTMYQIIREREIAPYESYEDLKDRVSLSDPVSHITRRILKELRENEKYNIFTRSA